jgi:hypothetical protein
MLWVERYGPVPMVVAVVARATAGTTADSMKRRKE